jgi:hypothetical protein
VRTRRGLLAAVAPALLSLLAPAVPAAALGPVPPAWEYAQELAVPAAGLVEVRVPAATLDRAARGMDDLRVLDGAGREVPFVIPAAAAPGAAASATAAGTEVSLVGTGDATVGVYRTFGRGPIDTVTIRTPARDFVKPVTVEASDDRTTWRALAVGYPVFRQADGAERLAVRVAPGVYPYLRVTVGDARERPIPLAGVATNQAPADPPETEVFSVVPGLVSSGGGATRVLLDLPARHLALRRVALDPDDAVFSREVTVASRATVDGEVREEVLARGRIHRVALAGAARAEVLSLPVPPRVLDGRSLVVTIDDGDSPPLALRRPVGVAVEPVRLRFVARAGERYALAVGNRGAKAPRYDLAAIPSLGEMPLAGRATAGPLEQNPAYRAEEPARGAPAEGAAIDVAQWRRSRRVLVPAGGVLALEIPPDVLAESPGLADLRLVADGRQVPYVLERNSLARRIVVPLEPAPAERGGTVSRWRVRVPYPGLPLESISCAAAEPVFRRGVVVSEEAPPERGGRRRLAGAVWERRGQDAGGSVGLALGGRPAPETLVLEVDDGDNPPLALRECTLAWRTSRVLFKRPAGGEVSLLCDNLRAGPPRYDLALLADELLAADAGAAALAPDASRARDAGARLPQGWRRWAFWGGLALVVAVLIVVIARLLPSPRREK